MTQEQETQTDDAQAEILSDEELIRIELLTRLSASRLTDADRNELNELLPKYRTWINSQLMQLITSHKPAIELCVQPNVGEWRAEIEEIMSKVFTLLNGLAPTEFGNALLTIAGYKARIGEMQRIACARRDVLDRVRRNLKRFLVHYSMKSAQDIREAEAAVKIMPLEQQFVEIDAFAEETIRAWFTLISISTDLQTRINLHIAETKTGGIM